MNFKHLYGYTVVVGMMLSSCIGDEAPNAECDIVTATLDNSFVKGNPIIENDIVTFYANPLIDLDELAPEFTLTPGATISPASGTSRNFTEPQAYT